MILITVVNHQKRESLVLISINQIQNFKIKITLMIMVIFLFMEKKNITLNPITVMLTFQHDFIQDRYLRKSVDDNAVNKCDIVNLHKYLMIQISI